MGLIKGMEQTAELIRDATRFLSLLSLLTLTFSFAPLCSLNENYIIRVSTIRCFFLAANHFRRYHQRSTFLYGLAVMYTFFWLQIIPEAQPL